MSELRVDNIVSQDGTAAPIYSKGLNIGAGVTLTNNGDFVVGGATSIAGNTQISGITTFSGASTFSAGASVTGDVTVTGALNVTGGGSFNTTGVGTFGTLNVSGATSFGDITGTIGTLVVTNDGTVGGALTVTGDLTVNGTTTTIDTATLSIEDSNIGIGSVSNPSNITADGAGITIFAGSDEDKSITWERDTGCFEFTEPCKFNGVVEKISAGTTYMSGSDMVLELNVRTGTVFTHTGTTDVGIVSFTGMPADTGIANGTSVTVIHTSAGAANTTTAAAFGKNCTVVGYEDGSAVAGISTVAFVGAGTSITMSSTSGDRDFVSFFIQYTGGTNTDATSYKVYATKNGGFRQV